ncbi:hypothetical protein RCO28_20680 [Streptomyces sp. LHD-70]|uniref:hypothetical protein n=1 Tax=Streptomyces sp. LHD-70 TaxID=3072140 RepID=UPI00280F6197|nr:hypothetical protein [Streptomyces sp. LHD-70]MDQ8704889.1 hypothetical protein [Streptomyces sp. LHD-70]
MSDTGPPWFESPNPMTAQDISERLDCALPTAREWARQGLFGEPVTRPSVRSKPYEYEARRVYLAGLRKGILNKDGTVARALRRGEHRAYSEETKRDVDGMELLNVPQVADMFGVRVTTVNQWAYRRKARGNPNDMPAPDVRDLGHVYWRRDTLRRWGRDTGRMDPEGNPIRKNSI